MRLASTALCRYRRIHRGGLYCIDPLGTFPFNRVADDGRFITVLRDPVEFAVSFYDAATSRGFRRVEAGLSIDDFIRRPADYYLDPMARHRIENQLRSWRPLFAERSYFRDEHYSMVTAMMALSFLSRTGLPGCQASVSSCSALMTCVTTPPIPWPACVIFWKSRTSPAQICPERMPEPMSEIGSAKKRSHICGKYRGLTMTSCSNFSAAILAGTPTSPDNREVRACLSVCLRTDQRG